mgnify:CR=1 FL=1
MEAVMGVANAMGDMVVNERLTVDGVDVLVGYANEGDQHVTETEIRAYLERGALKHPNSAVTGLALLVDGEDVDIRYELAPVPFDRIRRITGVSRGNDGSLERCENLRGIRPRQARRLS